jgi:hypothetical protein
MPANFLILPLLAGFWFLHHCHRYRFTALNWDGYRLLIESAVNGFLFLSLSRGLILLFEFVPGAKDLVQRLWNPIAPIPYLGSAIGSFVLAVLASFLDNRSLTPTRLPQFYECLRECRSERLGIFRTIYTAVRHAHGNSLESGSMKAVQEFGNPLVRLLDSAARSGTAVSITLKNRKWYVGYVSEAISLDPSQTHFRVTPLFSGYRNKDTLSATAEISYRNLYAGIKDNPTIRPKDFDITIPLADVEIANYFREDYYVRYFATDGGKMIRGEKDSPDDAPSAEEPIVGDLMI